MTQTIQPRSWALLSEAGKSLHITETETETEDNRILLLSVFDSMNTLCEKLSKLEYVLKRKKIELIISNINMEELK